ncbi:MAG: M48 family metallopeptidase [Candidatus Melainabacteria bacterium]|nr:M48 family metallopeptidase [Candidatus Melainabacteria bacterium]
MTITRSKIVLLTLLCQALFCATSVASADEVKNSDTPSTGSIRESIQKEEPVPSSAPVAATLEELHLPKTTDSMLRYSRIRYALFFFAFLYSLGILFFIMQSQLASRLRDYAIRANRNKAVQIVVFSVLLTLTVALFSLPLSIGSGFYLEHAFKLSDQSLVAFLIEKLKAIGVSSVLNIIALLIFFGTVKRFRVHWPLVLWLISIPVIALGIFAEPIVIDPLFNKFTPMVDGSLKTKITDLAVKAKIPNAVILVADKSKQTNKMNAYVTGLGDSSRIVLWDSTINRLPEDQVLAVVGHEIGHYSLQHIYWGFGMVVLATLLLVPFGYFGANWFIAALPKRWQVGSLTDYAVTPALMILSLSVGFITMPLFNFVSRYQEHQADRYGLELTDNRLAMANLFVSFAEKNLSEPDPPAVIKFFLFTHPTLKERIEFAAGRKVH